MKWTYFEDTPIPEDGHYWVYFRDEDSKLKIWVVHVYIFKGHWPSEHAVAWIANPTPKPPKGKRKK